MKFVKDFVIPTTVLTVICLVVAVALVATYQITLPIITENSNREANAARAVVLEGAEVFEKVTFEAADVIDVYKADKGYVITTKSVGYGGDVVVMSGITTDGNISGVKVLQNEETPGLGSKITEDTYINQYIGKDSTLKGVESIAGATISSNAMRSAVNIAFSAFGEIAGVKVETAPPETTAETTTVPIDPEKVKSEYLRIAKEIMPEASDFDFRAGEKIEDSSILLAKESGAVIVATAQGFYKKPLRVLVAFDPTGTIVTMRVDASNETGDLGGMVGDKSHYGKYIGLTGEAVDSVEAVAGATVSSDALKAAVKSAVSTFESIREELNS